MGLSETKLDTKMVASVKLVNEYKQKKKNTYRTGLLSLGSISGFDNRPIL